MNQLPVPVLTLKTGTLTAFKELTYYVNIRYDTGVLFMYFSCGVFSS